MARFHQTPRLAGNNPKPSPRSVPARRCALNRLALMSPAACIALRIGACSALLLVACCALADTNLAVAAPSPPVTPHAVSYTSFITEASRRFHIPEAWIYALIHVESRGNADAVSPKGAMGLMQIMPDTWAELRLRYRLGADPFDPHDNILGGTAYLRELYDRFGARGFLAAYNAGPRHYRDYISGLRPLREETKSYLAKLARLLPALPIDSAVPVAANASDWRRAALFTARPVSPPLSAIAHSGHPSADASSASVLALTPHSDGLFVPVTMADL